MCVSSVLPCRRSGGGEGDGGMGDLYSDDEDEEWCASPSFSSLPAVVGTPKCGFLALRRPPSNHSFVSVLLLYLTQGRCGRLLGRRRRRQEETGRQHRASPLSSPSVWLVDCSTPQLYILLNEHFRTCASSRSFSNSDDLQPHLSSIRRVVLITPDSGSPREDAKGAESGAEAPPDCVQ